MVRALTITVGVLLLAACGSIGDTAPNPPSRPSPTIPAPAEHQEPTALGLVGLWRVDATTATPDTWLWLGAGEFHLSRPCGFEMGAWRAGESAFLAQTHGWHTDCAGDPSPWLDDTTSYRAISGGWELLDDDLSVTATLRIDGAPPSHPDTVDRYRESPAITADVRAHFLPPAGIPESLEAATALDIVGDWVPITPDLTGTSGVSFRPPSSYSASDGCNRSGGRWAVEEGGLLLTAPGISTMMGCDGVGVPGWVASARRVAKDGEILVLLDLQGAELGRLAIG